MTTVVVDRRPHCAYPHPRFPRRRCDAVLGEQLARPWEIKCWRCGRMVTSGAWARSVVEAEVAEK